MQQDFWLLIDMEMEMFMNQYTDTIKHVLAIVGVIKPIILIAVIIYAIILWSKGIFPVLYRLGNGLSRRRIAVFAKSENIESMTILLLDSKLFKQKNIIRITAISDLGRAEEASVYLVHWHDWADNIDALLKMKHDRFPLIVYAPYDKGRIPDDQMKALDGKRNTAITNFRGRLLNDVVTAMITTSFK